MAAGVDIIDFAREYLGVEPSEWQKAVFRAYENGEYMVLCGARGHSREMTRQCILAWTKGKV